MTDKMVCAYKFPCFRGQSLGSKAKGHQFGFATQTNPLSIFEISSEIDFQIRYLAFVPRVHS